LVADGQIRAIKALKVPRPTDDANVHATYVREIHRLLSTLYNLEVSRGVHVPQLWDHITSHTFLLQIAELLPIKVKSDWTESLARRQMIIHRIEGEEHLIQILELLKQRYISYELLAGISPNAPVAEKPATRTLHAERDVSPSPSVTSSCPSCTLDNAHGAAVAPKGGRPKPSPPKQAPPKKGNAASASKPHPVPWSCTLKDHAAHLLIDCPEFFKISVKERRRGPVGVVIFASP
jgi:hypothetical protein